MTAENKFAKRIVCAGSRLISSDSAGLQVYDLLKSRQLPTDVQIIDGGLAGLDLIRYVDGAVKMVFVDAVSGFDRTEELVVLNLDEVIKTTTCNNLNHACGLIYLLHALPNVFKDQLPTIFLVGINGAASPHKISKAASVSVQLLLE
jgi:hydrogenase maturation protease